MKDIKKLKKESLDYSINEGFFATIKDSVVNNYISPFAIAINSSNSLIAMLSSIPGLLGPISQWQSSRLIEKYSRKKIVLISVFFEILVWIPLIMLSLLYYQGIITNFLPMFLLIFFSIYVITANAGAPAWFSWMGDLVEEEKRGRWFAKRNFVFSIVTLVSAIVGAIFLDFLKRNNLSIIGFAILFLIAMISRIISRNYLKKQYEPKLKIEEGYYFSFPKFIRKAPFNNFGRFSIFRALLNCMVMIASPFFAVYMLKDLNFNYLIFMTVVMSQTFFMFVTIKFWGNFSDKYGNYETLRITSLFLGFIPILWIFSKNPVYLVLIPQLISGIAWGGFNLASSNYVFDCVTPQKRSLVFSYYELLNGIGIFIGAGIGAVLIENLTINFMNKILFIFIISGILRIFVALIMLPKIKEVKNKKEFDSQKTIKHLFSRILRNFH